MGSVQCQEHAIVRLWLSGIAAPRAGLSIAVARGHIWAMTDTSTHRFEQTARRTIEGLPEPFRRHAREVALLVADWPAEDMLAELGLADAHELTGLYEGTPMTEKSVWDSPMQPDTVWLFRRPILAEWRDRGNVGLDELIAHVVIHEFAHHFGWSDDDIAAIDPWWE